MAKVKFFYIVEVLEDDSIMVRNEVPEEAYESDRPLNPQDVVYTSQRLAFDIGQQLLTSKIAQSVEALMAPQATGYSEQMLNALKERGITPEAPVE